MLDKLYAKLTKLTLMKKILIPTNFSMPAGWATELATYLAEGSNAEMVLLHVVESVMESFDGDELLDDVDAGVQSTLARKSIIQNQRYLNELAENLRALGISVKKVIRQGNLLHAIKTVALDFDVDLIVMGTSKRTRMEEILDQSRTEQVVKSSPVPVLVTHEKPSRNQFRNIVYGTSQFGNVTALPEIITNAQRLKGSKLHIVTVDTGRVPASESDLKRKMEEFALRHNLTSYSVTVINDSNEETGIIRFANEISADLIVIPTHGRTRLWHEVKGNIPQDIVNHSRLPVMTYMIPS